MHTVPPLDEVVTRWVTLPLEPLEQALQHPDRVSPGALQLRTPFDRDEATWTARGRLQAIRARVELQITAWPNGAAEVTLRPARRRLLSWSPSRERRYFDAAHDAATQLARTLASVA